MRKVLAFIALFALPACDSPPPGTITQQGYSGVVSEHDFWVRYIFDTADGNPQALHFTGPFLTCIADEMESYTPPPTSASIDKFLQTKNGSDFNALETELSRFGADFKRHHGLEPLYYAGDTCKAKGIQPLNS